MEKDQIIKNYMDYVDALKESVEIAYNNMQLLKVSSESLITELKLKGFTSKEANSELIGMLKEESKRWILSLQHLENATLELQTLQGTADSREQEV